MRVDGQMVKEWRAEVSQNISTGKKKETKIAGEHWRGCGAGGISALTRYNIEGRTESAEII